jgi:hypothetical protein
VRIAQGLGWGRKGGDGEGETRSNGKKSEWGLLTAVKRYLNLYNPESPDQVQTIRETRTFREKPGDSTPPESNEQICNEFDFG